MEKNSYFLRVFDAISESKFYKSLTPELGYQHKIGHIQKVLVFSQMIAFNERLNEEEEKILLVAAAFHDSGRIKDRDNGEHGEASSDIVGTYFKENQSNLYEITLDEIGLVQVAIAYHVIPEKIQGQVNEEKLCELCNKYNVDISKNFETVKKISAILKDADALDRTRFSSNNTSINSLNSDLLRTKTAKSKLMLDFSIRINQDYAGYVLRENYPNERIIENDNAKTLQLARHNYKINNNGVRKEEKDISLELVKAIFKNSWENSRNYVSDEKENAVERV